MRVTLISKAGVVAAYQSKFEYMALHRDLQLHVVVPPYWRDSGRRHVLEHAHTRGYELVVAPMALNGSFHTHFYPTLPEILRQTRPDLCHVDEEPYNLATWLAVRQSRQQGAKVLFYTWQNLLRRYPLPFRLMERDVYRHVDAAIAGNQDAMGVLRDKAFQGPVRIIPQFGVDPNLFRPLEAGSSERPFTVGYAGRLVAQKGLHVLADAMAGLDGEWRLMLCGTGPLAKDLQQRFARLGLFARLRFTGHVSTLEMPRCLNQMDVLVLPSLTRSNWKEQFGRVLIEAMACEVAVVGSTSGEIPNVIGNAGLIFPEGDAEALRAHLVALRDDEAHRRALARQGRERVLTQYTQSQIAARTVAFYRELCA
ncbi:MAG: glycosyltransferase family 4 protein [Anaerolineae bacterium]|nr:glycosyltransferase family 4 protein [Anaerolineae bacterium]